MIDVSTVDAVPPANSENVTMPDNTTVIHIQELFHNVTNAPLGFLTTTHTPFVLPTFTATSKQNAVTPANSIGIVAPNTPSVSVDPTSSDSTEQLNDSPGQDSSSSTRSGETHDLRPDRPVVVYVYAQNTGRGVPVLNILPALSALKDNEACKITGGTHKKRFGIEENHGLNSLYFARKLERATVLKLGLTCKPKHNSVNPFDRINPFTVDIEVHVV